jgi:hypothetical protein
MNWRHATQNNISAPSTIWQTKKMPNQNNDLALVGMKYLFDNQLGVSLTIGNLCPEGTVGKYIGALLCSLPQISQRPADTLPDHF